VRACGVTMGASQTTREIIRQAKRRGAYVVATGCLENNTMTEIDFGAGTNEEIMEHLTNVIASEAKQSPRDEIATSPTAPRDDNDKTRAFIKIQNGCNFNCAYCIIPHFRGRTQSISTKEIIKKIKSAEKNNFKEVILTGVNVCLYRDETSPYPLLGKERVTDLANLLKIILEKTKIPRIRLGSLDPRLIPDKLISLYKNPRLLPHMHLSLQSGSDKILKAMNRNYTANSYYEIVAKTRALNPLFSFTTDIIVGFPCETKKDFKASCDFVKKCKFTKVHVFPFSPRPGTQAAQIKNIVQDKTKTERVKKLIKISDMIGKKFAKQFIGQTRPVLFEQQQKNQTDWFGYTPEYIRIKQSSKQKLEKIIVHIKIAAKNLK